jgi:hypothetical protein
MATATGMPPAMKIEEEYFQHVVGSSVVGQWSVKVDSGRSSTL